ncbi:MAG: pyruvate kinase [Terrimicrobiaceae bacterium]
MSSSIADEIEPLIAGLLPIRLDVLQAEQHFSRELDHVHLSHLESARNLIHYLSLRGHDLRDLQYDLGRLGLSSLGRLESHTLATLDAVLDVLHRLAGKQWSGRALEETFNDFDRGADLLERNTDESLGEAPDDRKVRIMVTMPSEAASDPAIIRDFLQRGMDIMRVNCAHDGPEEWRRMVEYLRVAERESGKSCRIVFDLAGPKLRTGYVVQGTRLRLLRGSDVLCEDEVGALPQVERSLSLSVGDTLMLTPAEILGKPAVHNEEEVVYQPAQIGCSLAAVFTDARPGERIFFDDGKIAGIIRSVHNDGESSHLEIRITHAANGTAKLRAEKGINLPDTRLNISALTPKDREDLELASEHADLVSLSFVRRPEDVAELIQELDRLGAAQTGIILKIENRPAVEALPQILLTAMQRTRIAVMVARGDLGVEIGFERMAEIQEEILWLCEAAHVPVIWATQVLESLAKRGLPSRAEVTDAAMSGRAEGVMLNKGPHILLALDFLCDVLARMKGHQTKKSALMRKLSVAEMALK